MCVWVNMIVRPGVVIKSLMNTRTIWLNLSIYADFRIFTEVIFYGLYCVKMLKILQNIIPM